MRSARMGRYRRPGIPVSLPFTGRSCDVCGRVALHRYPRLQTRFGVVWHGLAWRGMARQVRYG
jgi:hypothetical protein